MSYLGSKGHRPRWIAFGSAVMGVGSIVFLLPHILAESYDYRAAGKVYSFASGCMYITQITNEVY